MTADDAADRDEIQRSLDELRQAWLAAPRVPEPDGYEFARWECLRRLTTADGTERCDEWWHVVHELGWVWELWSDEKRAVILREARRLADVPIEAFHCRREPAEVLTALVLLGGPADLEKAVELSVRAAPVAGDASDYATDPGREPLTFWPHASVVRATRGSNDLGVIRTALGRTNPGALAEFDGHLERTIARVREELDEYAPVTVGGRNPELAGLDLTDRETFLRWAAPRLESPDPVTRERTWRLLAHGDPESSDTSPATIARAWAELDSDGDDAVTGAAFYLGARVPEECSRIVDALISGMASRPLASVVARAGALGRWPLDPDARQWLRLYDIVRPLMGRLRGEPREEVRDLIGLVRDWPPKPDVPDELVAYRDSAWAVYLDSRATSETIEAHLRLLAAAPPVPGLARHFRLDERLAGSLLRLRALEAAATVTEPWPHEALWDIARDAVHRVEVRHEELTLELLATFIRRFARPA